jgi:hypothetical protein
MGRGLAHAHQVCRDHGATFTLGEEARARGARFEMVFRTCDAQPLRLLVIDDDEEFLQSLETHWSEVRSLETVFEITARSLSAPGEPRQSDAVDPSRFDYILLDCNLGGALDSCHIVQDLIERESPLAERTLLMSVEPARYRNTAPCPVYDKFESIRNNASFISDLRRGVLPTS